MTTYENYGTGSGSGLVTTEGYNDTEITYYTEIVVDTLSIAGSDVSVALTAAIANAQTAVRSFDVNSYLVPNASVPSTAAVFTNMVVESSLRIAGIDVNSFIGKNTSGTAFTSHDPTNGIFENDVYATQEVYLSYDAENYIKLSVTLLGMYGLLEILYTSPIEKQSLHKLAYTVDFDVDLGVNIQVEDFVPDITITTTNLLLDTDVSVFISTDADKIQPFITRSDFSLTTDDLTRVDKNTTQVENYAWLRSGIDSNTLMKGLFGEFLAENSVITVFRDVNNNNIISDDFLKLVVVEPTRYADQVTASGASSWTDVFYGYEHEAMLQELSDSFLQVWGNTNNIDWYLNLFKVQASGGLFNDGDVFNVPVELTFRYNLVEQGLPDMVGYDNLTIMDNAVSSIITSDVPQIERTFKILYKFNVSQTVHPSVTPVAGLGSGSTVSDGLTITFPDADFENIYFKTSNGLYAQVPTNRIPGAQISAVNAIFSDSLIFEHGGFPIDMAILDQFLVGTLTYQTVIALDNSHFTSPVRIQAPVVALDTYFNVVSTIAFSNIYLQAPSTNYTKIVIPPTDSAEVSGQDLIAKSRLFNYNFDTQELEEIVLSYYSGEVLASSLDFDTATVFESITAVNIPPDARF